MKRIVCLFAALVLLLSASACSGADIIGKTEGSGIKTSDKEIPSKAKAVKLSPKKFGSLTFEAVAENDNFMLFYDYTNSAIRLSDKQGSLFWDSAIDFEKTGDKLSNTWKQNVYSLFEISYSQPNENGRERVVNSSSRKLDALVWSQKIKGGISLQYYFPKREIGFTAEITLAEKGLSVNIPCDSIIENSKYRFVSITALPYFGAVKAGEKGYIVSPYFGGALLSFDSITSGVFMKHSIYCEETPEIDDNSKLTTGKAEISYSDSSVVTMPVIGMSGGDSGFFSYAVSGEEGGTLNISSAYYGIPYNRISTTFLIRNTSTLSFSGDGEGDAIILDDDIIPTDKRIIYQPLIGDNSSYSQMALEYKSYLTASGKLNKAEGNIADVSVEILLGVTEQRIMGNRIVTATTFSQARDIIRRLHEKGIENAVINLKGWSSGGYGANPTSGRLESKIGKKSELEDLIEYCKKIGYTLFLEADLTELNTRLSSVSAKKVAVVDSNGFYITNTDKNLYYQALPIIEKNLNSLFKLTKGYGISGICMNRFGNTAYRNYQGKVVYTSDYIGGISNMMGDIKQSFGMAAVRGSNLYALADSDYVYDVAVPFTQSVKYSEYVPFERMVMGGGIGAVTTSENSFFDPAKQRLLSLEYGMIPNFEVINGSTYDLRTTHYNKLFSAQFSLWEDEILDEYLIFSRELAEIKHQGMIKHEILADNVVLITYENGGRLLINKSDKDYDANGQKIRANSYLLLNGGEGYEN